jgi:hypothetical protein
MIIQSGAACSAIGRRSGKIPLRAVALGKFNATSPYMVQDWIGNQI